MNGTTVSAGPSGSMVTLAWLMLPIGYYYLWRGVTILRTSQRARGYAYFALGAVYTFVGVIRS